VPAEPNAPVADLDSAWSAIVAELRSGLPAGTFDLWVRPLRPSHVAGGTLFVTAPRPAGAWIERRYLPVLAAAVRRHAGLDGVMVVEAGEGAAPAEASVPTSTPPDPAHTFERFVIGPGNRLAHAAALAVAELPGEAYNPLFLYGPPGLGKTHLLGSIANYMRRRHPHLSVHLTTAERFTADFVAALRSNGPERFKERYRGLGALLIDDVQALEGKARTEEEFVHIFNALHAAGNQIVLSSDRPPGSLSKLAERLRDRFDWGLTVALEPPDLRTRVALLARMAAAAPGGCALDPAALAELARRVPGNVRRLEGAMTRAIALASLGGEPFSRRTAERAAIGGEAPGPDREHHSIQAVQDAVCACLGVARSELLSPARAARVVRARQLAMYLARELSGASLAEIARAFDRDHSTVLHAIRSVQGGLEPGAELTRTIHRVRQTLGGHDREPGGSPG